jgi:molecular chaperone HscB
MVVMTNESSILGPNCFSSSSSSTSVAQPSSSSSDDDHDHDHDNNTEDVILDSFQVLGLPRQFSISPETLKHSYRQLMTQYHPDKLAHNTTLLNNNNITSEQQQRRQEVEQKASQVTHAYQLLKEPHTRATHLLELLDHPLDETSQTDLVGVEFLMHVMELRELVDNANQNDALQEISKEIKGNIQPLLQELETAFDNNNKEDYTTALRLSAQLQYWHRLETAIQEKMEVE